MEGFSFSLVLQSAAESRWDAHASANAAEPSSLKERKKQKIILAAKKGRKWVAVFLEGIIFVESDR